jgi:hypothetical protein
MKTTIAKLFLLVLFFSSCQEDPKQQLFEQQKEAQKRATIFNSINQGWDFNAQPLNTTSRTLTSSWNEWRMFLNELSQKPKSSIGAFQQKAKTLTKRALDLNNNIPATYNIPEIKSRIEAIATKINSINLYIHLNQIPNESIVRLVKETNIELIALQQQLDEITVKKQIKMEDGEPDMLRMLDTARAIPSNNPNIIIKR